MKAIAYGELSSIYGVDIYSTWQYANVLRYGNWLACGGMEEEMRVATRRGNHYIKIFAHEHPRRSQVVPFVGCICPY